MHVNALCLCVCVSCCGWFPDISLCICTWRETSVCTVGLHWLEERWYMSICATVHMKATWLSTVLWFMPLITTTQKSSQQQQSSTEGWQQWDTCRSGDEKMFSYVTFFFFFPFFPSIIFWVTFFGGCSVYLSQCASLYLIKGYWWSKR